MTSIFVLVLTTGATAVKSDPIKHQGVLLRLNLSAGLGSVAAGDQDWSKRDLVRRWDVAFGGILLDRVALFGTVGALDLRNVTRPETEWVHDEGITLPLPETRFDYTMLGLGIGAAFFASDDWVVSAQYQWGLIKVAPATITQPGTGEVQRANTIRASLGYEWWVSDGWSLGPVFSAAYSRFDRIQEEKNMSLQTYTLGLGTTYRQPRVSGPSSGLYAF